MFGAAAIATPLQPTVVVSLVVTSVPLLEFLRVAIPLSLILALVSLLATRIAHQVGNATSSYEPIKHAPTAPKEDKNKLPHLMLIGFPLTLVTAVLMMTKVPIDAPSGLAAAILVASLFWGAWGASVVGKPASSKKFTPLGDLSASADGLLLIAVGTVAGGMLGYTGLSSALGELVAKLPNDALTAAVTMLTILALRFVGIGPTVIILTIGPVLVRSINLSPIVISLLFASASSMAVVLSPFSLTSAIASTLTGRSPTAMSFAPHAAFVTLGTLATILYIQL